MQSIALAQNTYCRRTAHCGRAITNPAHSRCAAKLGAIMNAETVEKRTKLHSRQAVNNFSWKVAGEAGFGILNAGLMFAKTCIRGGLYSFATAEYPSLIRGGHNNLDVRVSERRLFSHTKLTDLLVALDKKSIGIHEDKISENGGIIYDGVADKINPEDFRRKDVMRFDIPLMEIAGQKIMRNVVAMGATIALVDFDIELFNGVLRDNFGTKKGAEVAEANVNAAKAGYDYVKQNFHETFMFKLKKMPAQKRLFMSGHECIAAGAIKAGCKFMAAYPMTPATSILTNLAAQEKNFNLVVKHTEDEISAINMAIGASYAGMRAMTATSGGGFALMCEGFGLAGQTETPLVVVESQRPGPGTGMATHTSQGDLRYMLHASTDEFPRIIIAPGSPEECFYMAQHAFNFADKYQMPVVIMTDKFLGESYSTMDDLDENVVKVDRGQVILDGGVTGDYKRYALSESPVSPRAVPGVANAMHTASSYEHDEHGNEREEEEIRMAMHEKRFKKFEAAKSEIEKMFPLEITGKAAADYTLFVWGSTKGPALEALKILEGETSINLACINFVSPVSSAVAGIMEKSKCTIMVEGNMTAQLAGMIKEQTGMSFDHKILRYDGRPFTPEGICEAVWEIVKNRKIKNVAVTTAGIHSTS